MANLTYISDNSLLQKQMEDILNKVLNAVSKKLLYDFREHLDNTIYKPTISTYERYYKNGGFYSGWFIDSTTDYVRSLMFNGDKLVSYYEDLDNGGWSHGGYGGIDVRDMLPEILNDYTDNDYYSQAGGSIYADREKGRYWDEYLSNIDEKIIKWLDNEFNKYGISRG